MSSSQADNNVYKLHQIHLGMTQEQVYQIMRYPSNEDQITTEDGCYDIWFYVTKAAILDQSDYVPRNLTPLIFKDGIFVGMGYEYYESLVRKVGSPVAPEPSKNKPEPENFNLEKQLAPPSTPTTPEKPVKKTKSISMSSKPKKAETPPAKEDDSNKKLDEEDREMLEQEQEENFNDW